MVEQTLSTLYTILMKLTELAHFLYQRLDMAPFDGVDISLNGLQVGPKEREIRRVAVAVDACMDSFEAAAALGADLLLVHHGLFWGRPLAIAGAHYDRVKFLMDHDLSLFAVHLPLDAHPELGNNAQMAKLLGVRTLHPFGSWKGLNVGFHGELPEPSDAQTLAQALGFSVADGLKILSFGPDKIRTVGIVSGGAADDVYGALDLGLDAFITGECEHQVYHDCEERGITMICGGHYASEVFGVQAVGRMLQTELGLETAFVAIPTAL